jgi:hypothetical protein
MPTVGDEHTLYPPGDATWLTVRRPSSRDFERVQMTGRSISVTLDEPGRWVFIWSNEMGQTVDVVEGAPPGQNPALPDPAVGTGGPAYVPFTSGTGY